ncbi:Biotin carboxyl carrier protein of acetyl-CoA carboxylase [Fructilactobacillus florum 8D]|uniref:Biotin carboxyl carrier protein of acetyl-CoA carboxylase n=2 Tax=Fructilactobacillus florum TaxID=640331 RepID=W9EE51_9LACO|nr:biotin/lipoyl-containing protein [Fructilactobacillus florum]EKK20387.1 Biotin carboxyl carrier protein of acetyl-CoA carboxylase [Fructilactobacillus florum 2F]ETO40367.1 Biotin carboxyl carrier protein of acetyl-CoA carboxylase [Fructilactobacillus florum 8D]KRM92337.1 hypothetical protein FC87_GL000470 [Fructilactobacillus florum DSM 22689 = JCM 16035]
MDEAALERLLDKFDKSSLQELKLNGDGIDVYFSKCSQPQGNPPAPAAEQTDDAASRTATPPSNFQLPAPMVGLVYFAPSPDKPPYREVGAHVKKGDTVCAIEAMKLINEVKSPVSGTLVKRLVQDGEMVEYQQPLFEIKED